jgi:hypothetical protein
VTGGLLTLEPGVRIEFGTAGSLSIGNGGSMKAMGTMAQPITLTSIDPVGRWRGLRFNSSRSANNVLHYVTIARGGSSAWTGATHTRAGLLLDGNSLVDIQHSTIVGSEAQGVNVYGNAEMTFEHNTLRENAVAAWMHPNTVHYMGSNTIIENNVDNVVRVGFGNTDDVSTAQTWPALDDRKTPVERLTQGPRLEVQDRVFVNAALTIAPGAALTFRTDVSLIVQTGGSLNATGTAAEPIAFLGAEFIAGYWKGVQIRSASASNRFDHVTFGFGGGQPWTGDADSRAMVYLDGNSRALITNSSFQRSAHYALWVPAGGDISGFDHNEFMTNARTMIIHPNRVGGMTADNFFADNTENKVRVSFGNTDAVTTAQTWPALLRPIGVSGPAETVPYYVTTRMYVQAPLTIETSGHNSGAGMTLPGVVEFAQDASMIVNAGGSLRVNGVAGRPVIFRGGQDLPAYWQGIHIQTQSASNVLQNVMFSNAGSRPWFGGANSTSTLLVDNATATLSNVQFRKTGGYAIILFDGGVVSCAMVDHGGFMMYSHGGNGAVLQACP